MPVPRPSLRRTIVTSLAALLLAVSVLPATPHQAAAVDGDKFVTVANRYRADAGVGPVSLSAKVDQIAVERGEQLAADRKLGHDFDYIKKRFADLGVCWQAYGEIVAYNGSSPSERIEKFLSQWYNSDPHRKIMLGSSYTHAGGSWKTGSDGRHYGVMIFVKLCGASTAPAPSPTGFTDIGSSAFQTEIKWLVDAGITKGCGDNKFCPTDDVVREQMASFVKRSLKLPTASKDYFADDWNSGHQDDINRIAEASLTRGCDTARYCPSHDVTREQMASFLARAFNLPATNRDYFSDDEGSVHEDAINRLAAAGITTGCAAGRYCPRNDVTREQMAAFVYRAFH